jgi:ribosome production factor 2
MSTRIINGRRPKSKRAERALLNREPKVHENVKSAMFLRGPKTSELINQVVSDLYTLKKPHGIKFHRRNQTRPFEDQTSIEFFSNKNDCSLMVLASHQKKRPNNLVLGRFFDYQILDLIELGVENFKSIQQFEGNASCAVGFKPCFVFRGPEFEQKEEFKKFANLLLDFYRGEVVEQISLVGLDHVFVCTALDGKIYFRHYNIKLKKSGANLPRVELEEIGPSMDLVIRRTRFANPDLMKEALRQPKQLRKKKVKNVTQSIIGTVINVHKEKQDLNQMQTRKMKGLKRKRGENTKEEASPEHSSTTQDDDATKKIRS